MTDGDDPPRDAANPPGYDEDDPYADADLSSYPEWWQRNVTEFRTHGMRPYRPPRFADGTIVTERIDSLESELGVEIRFQAKNPQDGGRWQLVVDGDAIMAVTHERSGEGYTIYDMEVHEFERVVRETVT